MERKVFITAKIRDRLFDLIRTGRKRYEVRDASFEDARMIVYISAEDLSLLGIYELGESMALDRGDDTETIRLSGVSEKDFHELFPPPDRGGASKLWVARIGAPINVEQLLGGK